MTTGPDHTPQGAYRCWSCPSGDTGGAPSPGCRATRVRRCKARLFLTQQRLPPKSACVSPAQLHTVWKNRRQGDLDGFLSASTSPSPTPPLTLPYLPQQHPPATLLIVRRHTHTLTSPCPLHPPFPSTVAPRCCQQLASRLEQGAPLATPSHLPPRVPPHHHEPPPRPSLPPPPGRYIRHLALHHYSLSAVYPSQRGCRHLPSPPLAATLSPLP